MKLFVGIEGVSLRKSVAVLADDTGTIMSSVKAIGALSLHAVHRDTFRTRLVDLLYQLCQRADLSLDDLRHAGICIGLNGVSFPYEISFELPEEVRAAEIIPKNLICTGDAEIILASHAQSLRGSVIVCHIGAVALVASKSRTVRLGGWGPALGDEGSGYWIGRRAIRAIGTEYENGEPPSELWKHVDRWLVDPLDGDRIPDWKAASFLWRKCRASYKEADADPRTALLSFARGLYLQQEWQWRAIASSLVIPVMQAWDAGDTMAKNIVTTAALDLVRIYKRAINQCQPIADGPLVLSGGVLTHNARFRTLLTERLATERLLPSQVLTASTKGTMRPACGALLLALGGSNTGALRLPKEQIIRRLVKEQSNLHIQGELRND
jgi:N-acetylglucosamine kinase-like BadF-type ATPase